MSASEDETKEGTNRNNNLIINNMINEDKKNSSAENPSPSGSSTVDPYFHYFSVKLNGSSCHYSDFINGPAEYWNPSPTLKCFYEKIQVTSKQFEVFPCTLHPKEGRYLATLRLYDSNGVTTYHSSSCYSSKDKSILDIALQVLERTEIEVPEKWKIITKSSNSISTSASCPILSTPSPPLPIKSPLSALVNQRPSIASSFSLAGSSAVTLVRPSCLDAMKDLKDRGLLNYDYTLENSVVNGWVQIPHSTGQWRFTASFRNDLNEEYCINKCMKLLLRKAAIVSDQAEILYRQIDPKLHFFQGDLCSVEEGRDVEFKGGETKNIPMSTDAAKSVGTGGKVGKTVCAFLNGYLFGSEGGSVFIGIHDHGPIHGIDGDKVVMNFGLEDQIMNRTKWTVHEFYVKIGDKIKKDQKVCCLKGGKGNELVIHSIYDGEVVDMYKQGKAPVLINDIKNPGYLLLIKMEALSGAAAWRGGGREHNGREIEAAAESKSQPPSVLNSSDSISSPSPCAQEGIVTGVQLTRSRRDELKRAIEQSLLESIEPAPLGRLAVLLHPVEPSRKHQTTTPYQQPDYLQQQEKKYIENLEAQIKKLKAELHALHGTSVNTFVVEIRVAAADQLHFYHGRPFIRTGNQTEAMKVNEMKKQIIKEALV